MKKRKKTGEMEGSNSRKKERKEKRKTAKMEKRKNNGKKWKEVRQES